MSDYDRASRYLVKMDVAGHLAWVYPETMALMHYERPLDAQTSPKPKAADLRPDIVARIESRSGRRRPWGIILELFTRHPSRDGVRRCLRYIDRVSDENRTGPRRRDRLDTTCGLMCLTKAPKFAGRKARLPGTKDVIDHRNMRVFRIFEEDALDLLDKVEQNALSPVLLGWVPLMKNAGTQEVLDRWLALWATRIEDAEQRRDLADTASTLAELTKHAALWRSNMEKTKIRLSPFINVARAEERAEAILESIADRFHVTPPAEFIARVKGQDLETLRRWQRVLNTQPTFDDFLREIG